LQNSMQTIEKGE